MTSTIRLEDLTENSRARLLDGVNITHDFPAHVHESYTLGAVTRGGRYIRVGETNLSIGEGEGFIIDPLVPHACGPANGRGHDYRVISLETDWMKTAATDVFGRDCRPYFSCVKLSDNTLIIQLINLLKKSVNSTSARAEIFTVLSRLIEQYADDVDPAAVSDSRNRLALQVQAYLDAHIQDVVSLDDLSAETHVSPYYVDRVFREVIGVPPHVYQLQTRVKRASDILLQTGSITEAAYIFGFSDQSHFSRIFKKNMGVTPGQFIRANKKRTG